MQKSAYSFLFVLNVQNAKTQKENRFAIAKSWKEKRNKGRIGINCLMGKGFTFDIMNNF